MTGHSRVSAYYPGVLIDDLGHAIAFGSRDHLR